MAASWVNEVDDALWEKWKARQLDPPLVVDPPLVAMVLPRKSDRIRVFPNEALATFFNAHALSTLSCRVQMERQVKRRI